MHRLGGPTGSPVAGPGQFRDREESAGVSIWNGIRAIERDDLHPNLAGYAIMAPLAETAIQAMLATK